MDVPASLSGVAEFAIRRAAAAPENHSLLPNLPEGVRLRLCPVLCLSLSRLRRVHASRVPRRDLVPENLPGVVRRGALHCGGRAAAQELGTTGQGQDNTLLDNLEFTGDEGRTNLA